MRGNAQRPSLVGRAEGAAGGAEKSAPAAKPKLALVAAPSEAPADERAVAIVAIEAAEAALRAARAVLATRPPSSDGARWVSLDDLVARGVFPSARAGREAIASGAIVGSRNGRAVFFREEAVDAFLDARRAPARPRKAPVETPSADEPAETVETAMEAALAAAGLGLRASR